MKSPMRAILCAALICVPVYDAYAQVEHPSPLTVSRLGDVDLKCDQLVAEAARMDGIIISNKNIREDTKLKSRGIGIAGAVGGFLVGTVTGGIGFAAMGMAAKEANDQNADKAENVQDIAQQRRSLMRGIYDAKGCKGDFDAATTEREASLRQQLPPTPAPAQTPQQEAARAKALDAAAKSEPAAGEPQREQRQTQPVRHSVIDTRDAIEANSRAAAEARAQAQPAMPPSPEFARKQYNE